MNTADRSIEALDTALRRRFSFREMPPKHNLIGTVGSLKSTNGKLGDIDVVKILETINSRIDKLIDRLQTEAISELILATNLTVEGEATAHFIADKAKALGVSVSRIAYGVPMGGELEYVDGGTLNMALQSRKII